MKMLEKFRQTIKALAPVPDDQIDVLINDAAVKKIGKGDHFLRAGDIPRHLGFNLQGLFRYYYINRKGNEYTKSFVPENSFIISYSAMVQKRKSYFFIEALEDSQALVIEYDHWQRLIGNHTSWIVLENTMLQRAFILKKSREREFLLDDAETRYMTFLRDFPDMEGRIKQYLIASYLGITPVALSRIRKNLSS